MNKRLFGWEGDSFVCYFRFSGWDCLSLGAHVCLSAPNIEVHLPFGFVRVGRPNRPGRITLKEAK